MDTKKVAVIAALVVVIVIAAVLTAKRASSNAGTEALQQSQQGVMGAKVDKIDSKSFEVISETLGDWNSKYAADKSGYFKNPKTGEYTMTQIMKCASCGAQIPYPEIPAELRGKTKMGESRQREQAIDQLLADYMCPKCGKHASLSGGGGG